MSTDPKPTKPMPSADEINAYLEASAARTKLRLPLAQGKALAVGPAPARAETAQRALPVSKKLPTRREEPQPSSKPPGAAETSSVEPTAGEAWRPFTNDDDR